MAGVFYNPGSGGGGSAGPAGPGLPAGGTAAQIPTKIDDTDYNVQWSDPSVPNIGAVLAAGNDAGDRTITAVHQIVNTNFGSLTVDDGDSPTWFVGGGINFNGTMLSFDVNGMSVISDGSGTLTFAGVTTLVGLPGVPAPGADIDLAGGSLTNALGVAFSIAGVYISTNVDAELTIAAARTKFVGNPVCANDGSGLGGGTLYMDGGTIQTIGHLVLPTYDTSTIPGTYAGELVYDTSGGTNANTLRLWDGAVWQWVLFD